MNALRGWLQLQTLRRRLRMPAEDLRLLQEYKLRQLMAQAYTRVPYYRRLFDSAGVCPEQIKTLDDLRRIPLTHKTRWRNIPISERVARGLDVNRLIKRRTSGSTGTPKDLFFLPSQKHLQILYYLRGQFENGLRWRDRVLVTDPRLTTTRKWHNLLGLLRRWYMAPLETPEGFVEIIRAIRPDIIQAHPQHLRLAAHHILNDGGERVPIRIIFTDSEPLTEGTRTAISEAFGAQVLNHYGAGETYTIARECREHNGLHIEADHVIVECLKDGEPTDGTGEVFVTNLDSYAMPIIRYSLEDVAVLSNEPCLCGCTFPMIRELRGRVNEMLTLADGRLMEGIALSWHLDQSGDVAAYRFLQEEAGQLQVELVPEPSFRPERASVLANELSEKCDSRMQFEIRVVDTIQPTSAGKRHVITSRVRTPPEAIES